jgi:ParB family transcriptional regulator, chromosome partitioning protein
MKTETMQEVPVDLIDLPPQVRDNSEDEGIEFLSESMEENGLLHPPRLMPVGGRYRVVTGARRVRATRRMGKSTIVAFVEPSDLTEVEILARQLTENGARKALKPIEMARGIERLMALTGLPACKIGKKIGSSAATISRLLSCLSLPEEVQNKIQSGEIPASTAYQIAKVEDGSKQAELAKAVAEGDMTREAVTAAVNQRQTNASDEVAPVRGLAKLEGGRSVSVRADGLTLELFVACLERVLSSARKARRQGVELASFLKAFNAESRAV